MCDALVVPFRHPRVAAQLRRSVTTMSILSRLFRKPAIPTKAEHAVIVEFRYGSTDLQPIFALEQQLEAAIGAARAGEFDGNEVAADGSEGTLHMYGSDGDTLFATVRPVLEVCPFMRGARVRVRYGPPGEGVPEAKHLIGSGN